MVSESPVWVKIGDFGQGKLARGGTALRTQVYTPGYTAPEMTGMTGDSSEYKNAVDIWAVGCIAYEMLTGVLLFPNLCALGSYCYRPEFPRKPMLSKNISQKGMEIVESMLDLLLVRRTKAKEALDSEWLRLEDEGPESRSTEEGQERWSAEEGAGQEGLETEENSAGLALPEVSASPGDEVATEDSLPGGKERFRNFMAIAVDAKDQRTPKVLLPQLSQRLQVGFLGGGPLTG